MNSKLTAAHVYKYPNSRVTTKYDAGKSYQVVGVSAYEGNLQVETSKGDTDWWNIDQCQLLLTPLSAITDEHAIEVADIINLHYPFSEPLRFDCGLVKMGYQLQPNKSSSLYNYDVIDLLRSLGYDCDNAISEGWGVDKTSPKK